MGTLVCTDRRSRNVRHAPAAERTAIEGLRKLAADEVAVAKALIEVKRSRSYLAKGYRSIYAFLAEETGAGPEQIRRLLALGRSLEAAPEFEEKVSSGAVPVESAIAVGRVLTEPALDLTDEQKRAWIRKAEYESPAVVKDEAVQAIEDARQGEPTIGMFMRVTKQGRDDFRRSRQVASRGQRRLLTEGEMLAIMAGDWLERNDPERKPVAQRRSGHTGGSRSRYVPAQVQMLLQQRSGGTCEICHVERAVEMIHIVPHAKGGSREVDNLVDACRDCHVLVDASVFRFTHFDAERKPCWEFHRDRLTGGESERGPPP